jgi:hypothetical protein
LADIALYRSRRKATLSSSHTKLICGHGSMKARGSGMAPLVTRCDQS